MKRNIDYYNKLKKMEILEWHYAGRKHSWICRRYGITKRDIEELILQHGKGEK